MLTERSRPSLYVAVKCYGTEGRAAMMGLPEVMPAGQLYDMVVFQGSEIAFY